MKTIEYIASLIILIFLSSCNAQNKKEFDSLSNKIPKELKIDTIEQINFDDNKEVETIITASDSLGSFTHEFWFKKDKLFKKIAYPWVSINYKWFIDIDKDNSLKKIIRARGFEDGIDYVIYDVSEESEIPILYFNPALKDEKYPNEIFWGYPWDMKELLTESKNKLLVSLNNKHLLEGSRTVPENQNQLPFIFFKGTTTQPDFKLNQLNKAHSLKLEQILDSITPSLSKVKGNYSKDFLIQLEPVVDFESEDNKLTKIVIYIANKTKKTSQKIIYEPSFLMGDSIPMHAVSYSSDPKFRNGIESYHKIIFGDFNFDNLEDFAFINYEGSSSGPQYTFFIQNKDGLFEQDDFLTKKMRFFPVEVNSNENTLTTKYIVGCCKIRIEIFKLLNNNWERISSEEEGL